jgi:hypothetical protein
VADEIGERHFAGQKERHRPREQAEQDQDPAERLEHRRPPGLRAELRERAARHDRPPGIPRACPVPICMNRKPTMMRDSDRQPGRERAPALEHVHVDPPAIAPTTM